MVSPTFEYLLHQGSMRRLTEEELTRAVHIDPSRIRGLGPSLEALMETIRSRGAVTLRFEALATPPPREHDGSAS